MAGENGRNPLETMDVADVAAQILGSSWVDVEVE